MSQSNLSKVVQIQAVTGKTRHRLTWRVAAWVGVVAAVALCLAPTGAFAESGYRKLDPELNRRAAEHRNRTTRVVVRLQDGASLPASLRPYVQGGRLELIGGYVLLLPDSALPELDALPQVASAHEDRPAWAADYLSTKSTGADLVQEALGFTGRGIGVAVVDSGITSWHDDLTPRDGSRYPYGSQRVSKFIDFVNNQAMPYDDNGHGSHVAGIVLGNGFDSRGRQSGIAPDASLVSLKVLDAQGKGTISRIISALDWVAANARTYNIRVVNLSVGAAVTQSYWTDPLALAARRLTERGIVVVAAAGNLGQNAQGQRQYGGILAPGNAPWVLTVGASSTEGTVRDQDDLVATFSSLGPTRGDYLAKPDIVAPGKGILSLAVPGSTLYQANSSYLVSTGIGGYPAYMSLSGTSMAAPQVSGAVALMLQANPNLTPNLVKAILQYTAREDATYGPLQEGAGFLDVLGAVRLSRFYANNQAGTRLPVQPSWSRHFIWGNQMVEGGYINPLGNAWATNIVWGTAITQDANIVWGTAGSADNIVWGTLCGEQDCQNIVWGTADQTGANIVWGTADNIVWGTTTADNIVWGTAGPENIVWGTSGASENIVWGTACGENNCANIVWGTATADNIVWGTVGPNENIVWGTADNIVWGTLDAAGNIVWGTAENGNIVWGTADNIVWGTAENGNIVWGTADNIVWGTAGSESIVWGAAAADNIVWGTADNIVWGTAENIVWGTGAAENVLWPANLTARN